MWLRRCQDLRGHPLPWAFSVGVVWLIAAAFAFLPIVPYASGTAKHMVVIYGVMFVIAALASLIGRRRADNG